MDVAGITVPETVFVSGTVAIVSGVKEVPVGVFMGSVGGNDCGEQDAAPNNKAPPNTNAISLFMVSIPDRKESH